MPIAQDLSEVPEAQDIGNSVLMIDLIAQGAFSDAITRIDSGEGTGRLADGLFRGWMLVGRGDLDAAIAQFEAEATGGVLTQLAHYQSALAYALDGNYPAADDILSGERYGPISASPRTVRLHAQVLVQLGRPEDAIELLSLVASQDNDPSIAALQAAIEADPQIPFDFITRPQDGVAEVLYFLAASLPEEAGLTLPLIYARAAAYLSPTNTDARLLAAELLTEEERYELAIATYDTVAPDDPSAIVAEVGRATALLALDEVDRAVEAMRAAARDYPDNITVLVTLGDTLRRAELWEEAAQAYDAAINRSEPDSSFLWLLLFNRGVAYDNVDNWDLAEPDFRAALELNPGQPTVLNYLGYSLVERGGDLDEALGMIQQAWPRARAMASSSIALAGSTIVWIASKRPSRPWSEPRSLSRTIRLSMTILAMSIGWSVATEKRSFSGAAHSASILSPRMPSGFG